MTNLAAPPALPHSHEAEQSVLGALMYDNAVIERLPEHLRPEHFFEPFHVALFDAIRTTIASGGHRRPDHAGRGCS